MQGLDWFPLAVRMIRRGFEEHRLSYSDAVEAVEEVGRMITEDADLKQEWRVEA